MDISKATEIIKLLADGKHPLTKARLDENHVINEPDVIRALNKIIEALSSKEKKSKKQRDLPERVGKPWSENEDKALIKAIENGISINDLVIKHQRTRGAIRSRLVRLGKITLADRSPR
jgi:hypothetical protein